MNPQAANPIGRPPLSDQERQIQIIHSVMESCPFKFATSGVIGSSSSSAHYYGPILSVCQFTTLTLTLRLWFGCGIRSFHVFVRVCWSYFGPGNGQADHKTTD